MITTWIFNGFSFIITMVLFPITLVSELSFRAIDPILINLKLQEIIIWIITPLNYFRDIIDVEALLMALSFLLVFYSWIYTIRLVFWIVNIVIPWLKMPFFGRSETVGATAYRDTSSGKIYARRSWNKSTKWIPRWKDK